MTSPIELSLFDFVDTFATEVEAENVGRLDTVEESSPIITFCESFFDQYFAGLGHNITGFGVMAKYDAAELVERLRLEEGTKHTRAVIALYESFCDMYVDVVGGAYGGGSITYQRFHADYMRRLLTRAKEWAEAEEIEDLVVRVASAQQVYDGAMKAKGW